jgi:ATP-binding cassette subfamily B protein
MTRKRGVITQEDAYTLRLYFKSIVSNKSIFWQSNMIFVSSIVQRIVTPFAISAIIASLANMETDATQYVVLFVVSASLGVVANLIGFKALMKQAANTAKDMRTKVYGLIMKKDIGYFNNNISGKIVSDAIDFPKAFNTLNGIIFIDTIPFLLTTVIGITIIMANDFKLGIIMLSMSLFMIIWAWMYSYKNSGERQIRRASTRKLSSHIGDTVTNILAVKSFAMEGREATVHETLSKKLQKLQTRDWVNVAMDGSKRHVVLIIIQFIFITYLINLTRQNPESLTIGIFAFAYSINLSNSMFSLNHIIRQFDEALLEALPVSRMLRNELGSEANNSDEVLSVQSGEINIENVSFKYSDGTTNVFEKLDFMIPAKQRLGLVGPSGGGKSSLMRLLLRFEEINHGSITIDGQDISEVSLESLRNNIAYVPQEPLLFHRTIRENIEYGSTRSINESELISVVKKAYAYDFIKELPEGFDTMVGERGVKLSGGQKQRIAIARAILRDAPILLLDEATSALDSESEAYIQKALHGLMKNKTVIVIAHRLSTINELDRILVIDDGEITEQGTHKELLSKKAAYAKLWSHQSGGFIED